MAHSAHPHPLLCSDQEVHFKESKKGEFPYRAELRPVDSSSFMGSTCKDSWKPQTNGLIHTSRQIRVLLQRLETMQNLPPPSQLRGILGIPPAFSRQDCLEAGSEDKVAGSPPICICESL